MSSWPNPFSARSSASPHGSEPADIAELRRRYEARFAAFGPAPANVACEPVQLGPVRGEWIRPATMGPGRAILYFHGGGYIAGSPETHRPLVARFAQAAETAIFSADYRLGPEFAFPAGVRDGIDAYRHLLNQGFEAGSIVLAGDGAGGGLAFCVLLAIRNAGLALPAGVAAMSPWADLSLSGWSVLTNGRSDRVLDWETLFLSARHYLKRTNPSDPYASPAFARFTDFPPIMVHAGSLEMLRDDASRLGDRAADAGTPVSVEIYDGMGHLFQANPKLAEAKISLSRLGQFVRAKTGIRAVAGASGTAPGTPRPALSPD